MEATSRIGLAAVLGLVTEAMWLGIAVAMFTVVHQRTPKLALSLVALAAVILAVAVLENVGVMSMVSLSKA